MILVGFDVGGTFIDLVLYDTATGRLTTRKHDSSPEQLANAISEGLAKLLLDAGVEANEIGRVAHGTTVATNQLVERKGSPVALITTRGFRDVLEIGRMRRLSLFDLGQQRTPPLVERPRRLEIDERVSADGVVSEPALEADAQALVEHAIRLGAEAIAVCLLNSYANPSNERRIAIACKEVSIPVSLSSEVAPDYGEYERWTTTAVNSYVMPKTAHYLTELEEKLQTVGLHASIEIMQSNGGTLPLAAATRFPVRLIESGPAAGVAAAMQIGKGAGYEHLITLDMGGTSADVSVIVNGQPHLASELSIDGVPIRAIGIDVRSIGAGGGSIARLDHLGNLQVGPASAGADPGPACYGAGGRDATVTDADLELGYLDPTRFCRGERRLDAEAARAALARLAGPLQLDPRELAVGIVRLAVTRMAGAIRTITTEAGHDPRDFTLIAFGGAGPTHASLVAAELAIPEVIVPPQSALLSARGLLLADYRSDAYRTIARPLLECAPQALNDHLTELEREARAQVGALAGNEVQAIHVLELCYLGQQDNIPVVIDAPVGAADLRQAAAELDRIFSERFSFLPEDRVVQLVRLRVSVLAAATRPPLFVQDSSELTRPREGAARQISVATADPHTLQAPVIDRSSLRVGERITGPCVVEEDYCATLVLPGSAASLDTHGNLRLQLLQPPR